MIAVNKPANFYWEYICNFNQFSTGVTINYFNNNTLADVTAVRTNPGEAHFVFYPQILTLDKTYISFTAQTYNDVNGNTRFFNYYLNNGEVWIHQLNYSGNQVDNFAGFLTIRIYP